MMWATYTGFEYYYRDNNLIYVGDLLPVANMCENIVRACVVSCDRVRNEGTWPNYYESRESIREHNTDYEQGHWPDQRYTESLLSSPTTQS